MNISYKSIITIFLISILSIASLSVAMADTVVTIESEGASPFEGTIHPYTDGSGTGTVTGSIYSSALDAGIEWDTGIEWGSYESYISFSLDSIPDDAIIKSVTLNVYVWGAQEFYSQALIFSKVDFGELEFDDYSIVGTQFGTSADDTPSTWRSIPVMPETLIDPSEDYFQVKIYMERPKGEGFPLAMFGSALYGSSGPSERYMNVPYLVVTYEESPKSHWSPIVMKPIANTMLSKVNGMWQCIQENLPEEVPENIASLITQTEEHMENAAIYSNFIYVVGELTKAFNIFVQINEDLSLGCMID